MSTRMYLQLILTITFLFLTFFLSSAAACNKEDKNALIAFKHHFPKTTFPDSWETESDCCLWDAVVCGDSTGRVTSLQLTSNPYDPEYPQTRPINLIGTIPPSIGNLTALESLSFTSLPELVGRMPPEMAKLKRLKNFGFYNCGISGPIPSSIISEWTSLEELEFNRCRKLKGSIPPSLGNLVNLTVIILYHNKLSGTIPSSLFSRLNKGLQAQLELSNNKLTGPIPQSFASVDALLYIDVTYNELCGPLPTGGIFASTSAVYFYHNKCLCGPPLAACK